jgi:site-specific DNA-methyltransferase (adenine-specific)
VTRLDCIVNGDALDVLRSMPAACIHLIITSPPYNIETPYAGYTDDLVDAEYLAWMAEVWAAAKRVLVDGGRICVNVGENKRASITCPTYAAFVRQFVDLGMLYRGTIIWNKNSAAQHCAWGSWQSCSNPHIVPRHEYVLCFSKGQWRLDGDKANVDITADEFMACTRSVWALGTESKKRIGHPAPFPESLVERLVKFYSYSGNVVLDMFAGSGTVGVVAARLGRRFVLIDHSPEYCRLAQRRIERDAGVRTLVLKAGQETR